MLFLLWLHLEPSRVHVLVPLMPGQGFQLMAGSHPVTLENREQAVLLPGDKSTSVPQAKVLKTGSSSPVFSIKMPSNLGRLKMQV